MEDHSASQLQPLPQRSFSTAPSDMSVEYPLNASRATPSDRVGYYYRSSPLTPRSPRPFPLDAPIKLVFDVPPPQDKSLEERMKTPYIPSSPSSSLPSLSLSSVSGIYDTPCPSSRSRPFVEHILDIGPSHDLRSRCPPKLTNVTYTSSEAAASINSQIKEARTALGEIRKERNAKRAVNRSVKSRARLEARIGSQGAAARYQKKLTRAQQRKAEAALTREACIQPEVKRAKNTKITPKMIQNVDLPGSEGLNGRSRRKEMKMASSNPISSLIRKIATMFRTLRSRLPSYTLYQPSPSPPHSLEVNAPTEHMSAQLKDLKSKPWGFAGEIVIQDRLDAIKQALSEHTQDGARRNEPGRHSYHVDAAVSRENALTGLAVVYKSDRQDCASSWTAHGYRIQTALEQHEAEGWAIWQALQRILDKARTDRQCEEPQDPCFLGIIYSDCKAALQRICHNAGGADVQEIIRQSIELKQLGVDIQLHWVPGHRNVPGNELADLVSKKARLPGW